MKPERLERRETPALALEVQAEGHAGTAEAVSATKEAEEMRIVQDGDGWMLVSNDGLELSRRSTEQECQHHLDRLSAARAVTERNVDGGLIDPRSHISPSTARGMGMGRSIIEGQAGGRTIERHAARR